MAYNIIDILNKIIIITNKRKELYLNIDYKGKEKDRFELVRKVLIKSVDREAEYYKSLIDNLKNMDLEDIDFAIYDKISFMINEFIEKFECKKVDNTNDLFQCALSLHRDVLALFISIQGKLVNSKKDVDTIAYKTLCDVLKQKTRTINEFEKLLK